MQAGFGGRAVGGDRGDHHAATIRVFRHDDADDGARHIKAAQLHHHVLVQPLGVRTDLLPRQFGHAAGSVAQVRLRLGQCGLGVLGRRRRGSILR